MRIKIFLLFFMLLFLNNCEYFKKPIEIKEIARIENFVLTKNELNEITPPNLNKIDSVKAAKNYIDIWIKKHLLFQQAKLNTSEKNIEAFEKLVNEYRIELYTKTYLETLANRSVEKEITNEDLANYYEDRRHNFKLNEELLQIRYIHLSKTGTDFKKFSRKFSRFNEKDRKDLDSLGLKILPYYLNDSTWVKLSDIMKKIKGFDLSKYKNRIRRNSIFEIKVDDNKVFLVKINAILYSKEYAPLNYIKPILEEIIKNQRKINFIKKLEKEIVSNAIKKKQLELYDE